MNDIRRFAIAPRRPTGPAVEVEHVEEKTHALYAMLNFGSPTTDIWGHINVIGNIGLRAVRTQEVSTGSVQYPTSANLLTLAPCNTSLAPNSVVNPSCYLTPDILHLPVVEARLTRIRCRITTGCPVFKFGPGRQGFVRQRIRVRVRRTSASLRNYVQKNAPVIDTTPLPTLSTAPRRLRTSAKRDRLKFPVRTPRR